MKKVYLTGYKNQNLGDDLFFVTVLNRYSDVLFMFEDTPSGFYSVLFRDFNNIKTFPCIRDNIYRRGFNKLMRVVNKYWVGHYTTTFQKKHRIEVDAYLKIGGSIFIEPDKDMEIIKRKYIAEKKYFGNIPFFYIGCNFGPWTSPCYFQSADFVIRNCHSICFRDSYSYNLFRQNGHVKFAPDILFGVRNIFKCSKRKTKSLGVSLMNLACRPKLAHYYQSYIESISLFITTQQMNYDLIRLFSFCEPEGDGKAIEDLISLLSEDCKKKIEIITYNGNYRHFLFKFSEVEAMISTRFHAMILGFAYGIKTVPIVYSNKISNVLDDLTCDVYPVRLDNISKQSLIDAFFHSKVVNVDEQMQSCQKQFYDFDIYVNS